MTGRENPDETDRAVTRRCRCGGPVTLTDGRWHHVQAGPDCPLGWRLDDEPTRQYRLIDPDPDCPGCHGDGTDPDGRRCDCTAPPGTFQGEWPE